MFYYAQSHKKSVNDIVIFFISITLIDREISQPIQIINHKPYSCKVSGISKAFLFYVYDQRHVITYNTGIPPAG